MTLQDDNESPEDLDAKFAKVPANFPRPDFSGAVSGFQDKLLLTSYNGKYYEVGCSPPEMYDRWSQCEHLAKHLYNKSLESKAGKRSHMTEVEILDQYLPRLIATRWTTEPEARWTIRRAAELLGWPAPPAAFESTRSSPE